MKIITIITGIIFVIFGILSLIAKSKNEDREERGRIDEKRLKLIAKELWSTYVPIIVGIFFIAAGIKGVPIVQSMYEALLKTNIK